MGTHSNNLTYPTPIDSAFELEDDGSYSFYDDYFSVNGWLVWYSPLFGLGWVKDEDSRQANFSAKLVPGNLTPNAMHVGARPRVLFSRPSVLFDGMPPGRREALFGDPVDHLTATAKAMADGELGSFLYRLARTREKRLHEIFQRDRNPSIAVMLVNDLLDALGIGPFSIDHDYRSVPTIAQENAADAALVALQLAHVLSK